MLTALAVLVWTTAHFASTAFAGPQGGVRSTGPQLVDALNGVFGAQKPDARAVHAKGVSLTGTFRPAANASSVSVAPHLQKTAVPVTIRFSDFPGVTTVSSADPGASPRGMSIRFHLPDSSTTDIVSHSYNGFPTATTDEFRNLFLAIGASGPGVPTPTPLDKFTATHPIAKTFLTSQIPPPVSYGTVTYYGVNTFKFTNAKGAVTFGRYQIRPAAGEHSLTAAERAGAQPNYLAGEIRQRVSGESVVFTLQLQLAADGDKLDDPSIAWPASRRVIELGTIELTRAVDDNAAAEHQLSFNPGALPRGIEAADPMIAARQSAYPVSVERRKKI